MKLLSIDTSTEYLGVAVMDDEEVLGRVYKRSPRMHSSLLVPMIDRALKRSKTKLKNIDGFCISVGPGSFTGLRIGVTTVKGLAFVTKKPIVGVPTLDAIAENGKRFRGIICVVLDARKNKVYASVYRSDGENIKKVSRALLVPMDELLKKLERYDSVLFLGDFAEKAKSLLHGRGSVREAWHPRPEVVGRLGLEKFRKGKFVKVEDLEPLYLYSKECDITGR